ncbi:MAG: hypothetical protein JO189_15790 [Deltaproteobacteria bacterium]|nr:hypothetical protein [Deltaproteobacteria bacterium]
MPQSKRKEPGTGYKKAAATDTATFAVAIEAGDAPEWIELLPAGTFTAVDGRGPFENADPDKIVSASIAKMPQVGLVLDFDHSTDLAAPEGRPAPAAGWLKEFKVEHGAIFARIEWTQKAAEMLKAKEYRYISPVFEHNKEGKVERILRAALTNNPALTQLPALASAVATLSRENCSEQKSIDPYEEETMKPSSMSVADMAKQFPAREGETASAHAKRLMKHIEAEEMAADDEEEIGALADSAKDEEQDYGTDDGGQHDDEESEEDMARRHAEEMLHCSDEEMRAQCAKRHEEELARRMSRKEEACKMSAEPKQKVDLNALVAKHPMVVQMASDLNQLRLAQARKTAEHAVDQAIREGRLIPSQREWAIEYCSSEPKGFEKFIGAAPRILANGADGTFTVRIGEPAKGVAMLPEKHIEIFANLGLESKEDLEKCIAVKEKWDLRFPRPRLMLDDGQETK